MKKTLISLSLLILSSSSFAASSCVDTINKISSEINNASPTLDEKSVWRSLSTLQSALKSKPRKKIISEDQTEYRWACSSRDQNNFLIALTDKNNALLNVSGHTDTANGEAAFARDITPVTNGSAPINNNPPAVDTNTTMTSDVKPSINTTTVDNSSNSNLASSTDQAKVTVVADTPNPAQLQQKQAVSSFNKWFGLNVKDENQLNELSTNKIIAYFSKLRTCTPGTYLYPIFNINGGFTGEDPDTVPLFLLGTSIISASSNGICAVKSMVQLKDRTSETDCSYSQSTLDLYTDKFAESFSSEAEVAYVKNPIFQKKIASECKKIPSKQDIADENIVRDYIVKFKSCTPGTYTAKRLGIVFTTSISGYKNNKCIMQGAFDNEGSQTVIKCEYSQSSLDFFAGNALDKLNGKSRPLTPEITTIMQKAFQECNDNWMPL
jgi:hypothetical protein